MTRLLVFWQKRNLKPTGGPAGYNYELKVGLDNQNKNIEIDYLDKPANIKKTSNRFTALFRKIISHYTLLRPYPKDFINPNNYDVIHFHTTLDLYKARNLLKGYKGKVVLTSHSPQLLSTEISERVSPVIRAIMYFSYKHMIVMDKFAFNSADYIIFPCEEAEQPYEWWPDFRKAKEDKKFRYLLTGTSDCKEKLLTEQTDFRKKYNIPLNAFVISYVGRHNDVKGYSDLKKIGEIILNKYDDVYFLIGGKEEPYKGLVNPRWIEVGWTKEPHALIKSSNMFVLPNRETYFDLVMLEVLSLGVPVLASYTGGNRFFDTITDTEIYTYKDTNDFLCKLDNMYSSKNSVNRNKNRKVYEKYFTTDIFAKRYIELIEEISEQGK